jgi:hypothetical protein
MKRLNNFVVIFGLFNDVFRIYTLEDEPNYFYHAHKLGNEI